MKILHIIPSLNKGGAERLALDICNFLSKQEDIEVKMIILHDDIKYDLSDYTFDIIHVGASVSLSLTGADRYNVSALQSFVDQFAPDVIHSHLFEADIVSRSIDFPSAKWF